MSDADLSMPPPEVVAQWVAEAQRIAMRHTRDHALAEDLAQIALKRLLAQQPRPRNVAAWLNIAIRNAAIDHHRWEARRPREDADQLEHRAAGRTIASGVVERDSIREALDRLSPQHREALLLSAAGFTNAEIAEHLGFASDRTVAATLSRLRRTLRESRNTEK